MICAELGGDVSGFDSEVDKKNGRRLTYFSLDSIHVHPSSIGSLLSVFEMQNMFNEAN